MCVRPEPETAKMIVPNAAVVVVIIVLLDDAIGWRKPFADNIRLAARM